MNYFPLLKLAHLVLYFFIAAQGAFYLLGFYKVLSGIPSHDFILLRKAADPVLAPHLKILYILTLLVSLLILATHFRAFTVSTLVLLSAAVLLLGIDIFVALRVSEPLNKVIAGISEPFTNAASIHRNWLRQIYLRAFFSVGGFILLLLAYLRNI